jgi:hypothetical protein
MIVGVDPHKSSHTATAVDPATNTPLASLRIDASLAGYRQLLRWAAQFADRRWAIENARGLGRHLAQWLVARDEVVCDVWATATARVRELSCGRVVEPHDTSQVGCGGNGGARNASAVRPVVPVLESRSSSSPWK